jgi:hypothetical protein
VRRPAADPPGTTSAFEDGCRAGAYESEQRPTRGAGTCWLLLSADYPREIEEALYQHPGVLECAVIGVPDLVRGEQVLAIVAPKSGAALDPEELSAFAA